MLNLTLTALSVSKSGNSPFFTSQSRYSIKKSLFSNQFHPIFVRFSPISIQSTTFRKFTSAVIKIEQQQTVYSGVFEKRIVVEKSDYSINITDSAFVNINGDEAGGGLKIERNPQNPEFQIFMSETKFYNCSSTSTGGAFTISNCPIQMTKVCVTHSTAQANSAFSISTDSCQCNSSFTRQSHAQTSSKNSVEISADNLMLNHFNLTLPNDSGITNEKAFYLFYVTAQVSFISVDQWFSPVVCQFSVQPSATEVSTMSFFNFNNVTASDALISVKGSIRIQNFTRKDTTFKTAIIQEGTDTIYIQGSMFDAEEINISNVQLDTQKWDRNMQPLSIDIGYGPGCYNTPPPLSPSHHDNSSYYFIGIAGVLLVIVIIGIAYTVLCVIKKPRAVEESTQMQKYEMIDKFGEARITV